jgi:phosphotransferase system IIA component
MDRCAQLTKVLIKVIGKGIVIIDDKKHCATPCDGKPA